MRKLFFLISSAVTLVFALLLLITPIGFLNSLLKSALPAAAQLDQIGAATGAVGLSGLLDLIKLGFGLLGATYVGIAIIRFFAASSQAGALKNKLMLGLGAADLLGFVLTLIAVLSGKFNGLAWINPLIFLALFLFEAYFFFLKPEA